jgi:hypothetical protein
MGLFSGIGDAIGGVADAIGGAVGGVADAIGGVADGLGLGGLVDGIANLGGLADAVKGIMGGPFGGLIAAAFPPAAGMMGIVNMVSMAGNIADQIGGGESY